MKKAIFFLVGFMLVCNFQLSAQQFTAVDYWKMENDPAFVNLKQRQSAGESLTVKEQSFLEEHKTKLDIYFQSLSDSEKALYYQNRTVWATQPGSVDKIAVKQDEDIYSGERSMYSQYLVSSGFFGFVYGTAAAVVFNLKGGAAAGVPLLAAGASTLIPMLTVKDKMVTYNSLNLSLHGKTIGLLHGAALSLLITGDNVDDGKLMVGLATLSSIGLGRLGYTLGRDKPWSQGRVALYSYYGSIMPFEGFAIEAAFQIDEPRVYALSSFIFGAGGYLIADRVARWNDFTVGDVTSTQTLATFNGLLGLGILIDITDQSDNVGTSLVLLPAAGVLAGTAAGHLLLKDARLTKQQGRNTALAATGGAVIGLGISLLIQSDAITPYYLLPYATGIGSYALLVHRYKTNNLMASFENEQQNRWAVNIMPQNIFLNQKLAPAIFSHPEKRMSFLPAFSATLNF